jgi:ATP-dependent Clp protease adaptor protein ClpS
MNFTIKSSPKWKEDFGEDIAFLEEQTRHLIVHNDDFNTFDFVIDCLMKICEHTEQQAEQCTILIHFKGKCEVKYGTLDDLLPRHKKLLSKGLTSEIV